MPFVKSKSLIFQIYFTQNEAVYNAWEVDALGAIPLPGPDILNGANSLILLGLQEGCNPIGYRIPQLKMDTTGCGMLPSA